MIRVHELLGSTADRHLQQGTLRGFTDAAATVAYELSAKENVVYAGGIVHPKSYSSRVRNDHSAERVAGGRS